jgi:hypothetical protein
VSDHETMHERENEGSAVRARPCRCKQRSCKGVWPSSRRGPAIVAPHLLLFEPTDPTEVGGRSSAGRRRFVHFLRRGRLPLTSTSSSPESRVPGQSLVFGHGDLIVLSQASGTWTAAGATVDWPCGTNLCCKCPTKQYDICTNPSWAWFTTPEREECG